MTFVATVNDSDGRRVSDRAVERVQGTSFHCPLTAVRRRPDVLITLGGSKCTLLIDRVLIDLLYTVYSELRTVEDLLYKQDRTLRPK